MSEFEKYSTERKASVKRGDTPEDYTTQGYIMFKRKYAFGDETVREAFNRIAKRLASHIEHIEPDAEQKFFDLMWSCKLAPSTPVFCNVGTGRGHPVSCSGGYVGDSIDSFYKNYHENAMLSQEGYGTSSYLGAIRPRGTKISRGGEADGVVPVFDSSIDVVAKVSQGNNRRGNWAGYLEVDHDDFWELSGYIQKNPADSNIGWMFSDDFIEKLKRKDPEAVRRFNRVMYLRCRTGKGYIWKPDTANRLTTQAIKNSGITIKGSNLCSEIALPQDKDHTFSCVLSSLNLSKWDEITPDDIFWSIVFLDCVVEEMLCEARGKSGFERIVRFTEKSRALGLGALGFHTYLQSKLIGIEELEAMYINKKIFSTIRKHATEATMWLADMLGEPEWCKGTGHRNATLMAIAPNTSSALLCGGVSQGIEPVVANAYNQPTAAGEMTRMNPIFVKIAKERGMYSVKLMQDLAINWNGSVQHLDWLTAQEKLALKTAFETDQLALARLAAQRQPDIDQGQSLNFFSPVDEIQAALVIKEVLTNPNIKGAYYHRSLRGIKGSTGECVACHG